MKVPLQEKSTADARDKSSVLLPHVIETLKTLVAKAADRVRRRDEWLWEGDMELKALGEAHDMRLCGDHDGCAVVTLVEQSRNLLAALTTMQGRQEQLEHQLRSLVMSWDANQLDEFAKAMGMARRRLGLKLHDDKDAIIDAIRAEDEKEPVRCCVHGKFPVRTPCQMCNPFRR